MGQDIWKLIIPGLVTVLGNIVVYIIVKNKIDKSIQKYNISYSGVFKEKIDIYHKLLQIIYDLKSDIKSYHYTGDNHLENKILKDFELFLSFSLINQPYLSEKMLSNLATIREELEYCFEASHTYNSELISPSSIQNEISKMFFESGNKFKSNHPFADIEKNIIEEMRKELQIK
jgi:hypothetical protein